MAWQWQTLAASWLAQAAGVGLIVLAFGALAARLCRQPVRRARMVTLTLAAALIAPWLGMLPLVPRWSAPISLPHQGMDGSRRPAPAAERAGRPVNPVADRSAAVVLPPHTDTPGSGHVKDDHPVAVPTPEARSEPAAVPWGLMALGAYGMAAAGLLAWWLLGQVLLLRASAASRPVSSAIRARFDAISGTAGRRVLLRETERLPMPVTFTWVRPRILVPTALCEAGDSEGLHYALAHEWSHVERRDSWAWNLATLAGLVLFFQPLYWWLRRQLRLCQDYLADDRAAAVGSAEDYAQYLVRLARARPAGPDLPALGIVDRRSNLFRRIHMLVHHGGPLEHRCRASWSLTATAAVLAVTTLASGFRLGAASREVTLTGDEKAPPAAAKSKGGAPAGETLHYSGTVKNKDTGKPIAGATVVVRRSVYKSEENRVLQETKHTTGADGTYSFTIPPEQVAEPALYIELDVEHSDYATRAGFGYALSMTRKNEKLNERPFFETIEMRPAQPITGRVETPEGKPAAGVDLLAYSRTDKIPRGQFEYGSFARAKTDAEGRFRLPITTPGRGVFWILPKAYAPELHLLPEGKRGDVGTFTLKRGLTVTGRVLDVQGKPLAGVFVEADRERGSGPESEALGQLTVGDAIRRTAETDAEGRFTFDPLPPGSYRVMPIDVNYSSDRSVGWTRHELPGVFAPTKLTIKEGEAAAPLEVRASPHVVIEGQWLDSKGQPKSGWSSSVFGKADGSFWHDMTRPDAQGKFSLKVPHGLEDVQLDISTNEHASAQHRIGKEGSLIDGRTVRLGTLDHDVKGIEIVRYVAPIIVINATMKGGQQVKGFKATVQYANSSPDGRKDVHVVGGGPREAIQDEQYDGRYRTSQLLPDREVNVTVSADGFKEASRKLSVPEGKTEEVTFMLEPK